MSQEQRYVEAQAKWKEALTKDDHGHERCAAGRLVHICRDYTGKTQVEFLRLLKDANPNATFFDDEVLSVENVVGGKQTSISAEQMRRAISKFEKEIPNSPAQTWFDLTKQATFGNWYQPLVQKN